MVAPLALANFADAARSELDFGLHGVDRSVVHGVAREFGLEGVGLVGDVVLASAVLDVPHGDVVVHAFV